MTDTSALACIDEAIAVCNGHAEWCAFSGRPNASDVDIAEAALGTRFPPSYRRFIELLGAGSFRGNEFYGVLRDRPMNSGVPSVLACTRAERKGGMPGSWIVVANDGAGGLFVLRPSGGESIQPEIEYPVHHWERNCLPEESEQEAPHFGAFFLSLVKESLSY